VGEKNGIGGKDFFSLLPTPIVEPTITFRPHRAPRIPTGRFYEEARRPNRRAGQKPSIAVPLSDIAPHRQTAFWRKVAGKDDPKACWIWTGGATPRGYGRFKIDGRLYSTHRIAFAIAYGGIPDGEGYHGTLVCHSCDNPRCCNPKHLSLGTAISNAKEMAQRGRTVQQRAKKEARARIIAVLMLHALPASQWRPA
jgi:HNH endonuclease